jgi:hypothetical protein
MQHRRVRPASGPEHVTIHATLRADTIPAATATIAQIDEHRGKSNAEADATLAADAPATSSARQVAHVLRAPPGAQKVIAGASCKCHNRQLALKQMGKGGGMSSVPASVGASTHGLTAFMRTVGAGLAAGGAGFVVACLCASAFYRAAFFGWVWLVLVVSAVLFAAAAVLAWRHPRLGIVAAATVLVLIVVQLATSTYTGPAWWSLWDFISLFSFGARNPLLAALVANLATVSLLRLRDQRTRN